MSVKFRWHGSEYAARIIGEGTKGRTLVEALEHGPRFSIGSTIEVTDSELILPFDTSTPPTPNEPAAMEAAMNAEITAAPAIHTHEPPVVAEPAVLSAPTIDALQKAMDDERKTLPTVAEVLANPNPTPPLSASSQAAAPQTGDKMTEALGTPFMEKMKAVANATANIMATMTAEADALLDKKAEVETRMVTVFAKHKQVLADAQAGLNVVDDALRQMSNGGPA